MSHDTAQTAGYSWEDPHAFHHDTEGHDDDHGKHHVTSVPKLVGVLVALLILTALTVGAATAESWAVGLGVHFSQFWNVVIALTIAIVKASLVCMFFMHLKHDNPLNTMVLLTTLFVFGIFLMLTSIDVTNRGTVNAFKDQYVEAGGTGRKMLPGGADFGENIASARKQEAIAKIAATIAASHGRAEADDDDKAEANTEFWEEFYHHKVTDHHGEIPPRHADDTENIHAEWLSRFLESHRDEIPKSDSDASRPRYGLTPGLFDQHEPRAAEAGTEPAEADHGEH